MKLDFFDFLFRLQIDAGDATSTGTPDALSAGIQEGVNTTEISIWELVVAGGWYIMIPLAICSVLAVYIFIERFLAIQRALKEERDFMSKIKDYVNDGKLDAAKQLCSSTDNPMARMIGKGISKIGKDLKDIAASIENVGKLEVYRLETRLSILATIAGAAPMIGFLGTVIGMISTFHQMSNEGVEIQNLSGGIMQAMVTTVAGLIVGILAYVTYNYLVSKVEKVIQKMEGSSIEFLDILDAPGN